MRLEPTTRQAIGGVQEKIVCWSLTEWWEKLIEIGAEVARDSRHVSFQRADAPSPELWSKRAGIVYRFRPLSEFR